MTRPAIILRQYGRFWSATRINLNGVHVGKVRISASRSYTIRLVSQTMRKGRFE